MGWTLNYRFRPKVCLPAPLQNAVTSSHDSPNSCNAADLLFQTEPILQRLLTEFEQAVRDSATASNGHTSNRGSHYYNFYAGCSDTLLMNLAQDGSFSPAMPDADGQTILNIIVGQQRALPTIRRMVEAGADPMTIDGSGVTSVHLALRLERKDIAWLLLTLWKTKRGF